MADMRYDRTTGTFRDLRMDPEQPGVPNVRSLFGRAAIPQKGLLGEEQLPPTLPSASAAPVTPRQPFYPDLPTLEGYGNLPEPPEQRAERLGFSWGHGVRLNEDGTLEEETFNPGWPGGPGGPVNVSGANARGALRTPENVERFRAGSRDYPSSAVSFQPFPEGLPYSQRPPSMNENEAIKWRMAGLAAAANAKRAEAAERTPGPDGLLPADLRALHRGKLEREGAVQSAMDFHENVIRPIQDVIDTHSAALATLRSSPQWRKASPAEREAMEQDDATAIAMAQADLRQKQQAYSMMSNRPVANLFEQNPFGP